MASRTHARWITGDLGALLAIEDAGTVVSNLAGADIDRMARAAIGKASGRPYAELLVYGDGPFPDKVSIGIATSAASLAAYVGGEAVSWGYRADTSEGQLHNNGAAVVTGLPQIAAGTVIGIYLDLDSDPQRLFIYFDGSPVVNQSLGTSPGAGSTWYLAASAAGVNDGDVRIFLNAGTRAFEHAPGGVAGWYDQAAAIQQIRLAGSSFLTASTDTPPGQLYLPRIVDSGIAITTEVSWWPMGLSQPTAQSVGELRWEDPNGDYDWLLSADARDTTVWLSVVEAGKTLADAIRVGTVILDGVEAIGDDEKVWNLRSTLTRLDQPLQRRLFAPNAESHANEPMPIVLGGVRNFEPYLTDEATNTWRIADAPITSMGDVRVGGVKLDPEAATPEYTLTADREHIQFDQAPTGRITVEVSTLGDASTESQPDLWNDYGDPFADADMDTVPDGWDQLGYAGSTEATPYMTAGGNVLKIPVEYFNRSFIGQSAVALAAGKTYRMKCYFSSVPPADQGVYCFAHCALGPSTGANGESLRSNSALQLQIFEDQEISGTFSIQDTYSGNLTPYFLFLGNNGVGQTAICDYVDLYELPDAFAVSTLPGLNLEQLCYEILEKRGGLDASQWSRSDAQAIDAATGYTACFFADSQINIDAALLQVLAAWSAVPTVDENGVLRFIRLADPADTPDNEVQGDLNEVNINSEIDLEMDKAKGLTTSLAGRRNWAPYRDADFGDATLVDVNQATRRALSKDYQVVVNSAVDLPGAYRHAVFADPQPTLLDKPEHLQAEVDYVCTIYSQIRWRYTIRDVYTEPGQRWRPGDVWRVTYPRHGLENGKKLMVVRAEIDPMNESVSLALWG